MAMPTLMSRSARDIPFSSGLHTATDDSGLLASSVRYQMIWETPQQGQAMTQSVCRAGCCALAPVVVLREHYDEFKYTSLLISNRPGSRWEVSHAVKDVAVEQRPRLKFSFMRHGTLSNKTGKSQQLCRNCSVLASGARRTGIFKE